MRMAKSSDPRSSLAAWQSKEGSPLVFLSEGLGWGVDSYTLPPTLDASLASKFSSNWAWSPDVKPGLATVGQDLVKAGSANPGWLFRRKDPPAAQLPAQTVAKQGRKCNCWQQIKPDSISTFLLISEWPPARGARGRAGNQ